MTRAQLQAAVFDALDNGKQNGWDACLVSDRVIATELGTCCAAVEGISERRLIPAVVAWKVARGCKIRKLSFEEQMTINLHYQGAKL